jgi:hypothetical protein
MIFYNESSSNLGIKGLDDIQTVADWCKLFIPEEFVIKAADEEHPWLILTMTSDHSKALAKLFWL